MVINDASEASKRVGEHYAQSRTIPSSNVLRIKTSTEETITRATFTNEIETPIGAALRRGGLQDRILYIVLTKGVPLRVADAAVRDDTASTVDSELTLLYRRLVGGAVPTRGRVPNPYYLGAQPLSTAQPFTHRTQDIYLVTRLDAFTVEEAIQLIDRGRAPVNEGGRFVLDQRAGIFSNPLPDAWLGEAGRRLSELGLGNRVVVEHTPKPARDLRDVVGYYSWASDDPQNRARAAGMRFVPGAIAATFVGSGARTFELPPPEWLPSSVSTSRDGWFAGSPQSLIGDLIREGVTGVAGQAAETNLQSSVRPEILFPAYVSGFNLAESFYLAMPELSGHTVVVGDPLCTAFARKSLTTTEIDPGTDADTELPAHFAAKRMAVMAAQFKGATPAALAAWLRSEARITRGDQAGQLEALERVTELSPDLVLAQLQLAMLYEQLDDFTRARERYTHVLKLQPNNVVALNNLAYGLAVREQKLADALPFARRAVGLAPNEATIVDTLAWIEHLNGNSAEAARLLRNVVQGNARTPDVHLHAAIVFAAVGELEDADVQLRKALELNPALEKSADVVKLRERLPRK